MLPFRGLELLSGCCELAKDAAAAVGGIVNGLACWALTLSTPVYLAASTLVPSHMGR
jgi:hypothetical protein